MSFVCQDAGKSCDVVVICKCHQMFPTVNAPWISPELAVQRMGDLEQIHGIEAGVQALVTFIICAAVKHFIIDDNIIITKKNFTNQCKIRL